MVTMIIKTGNYFLWPLMVLGAFACGDDSSVDPPVPAAIQAVDGNGQVGAPGATLQTPLTVQVTDAQGDGVAGVTVSWSALSGSGSVSPGSSTTDSAGRASAEFTLGTLLGQQQAQAEVSGLTGSPVGFTETASEDAPAPVVLSIAGGGNNVPKRYSSDLWVAGNYAYTGTWNYREAQGNVLNVWSLGADGAPSLAGSVTVPNVGTVSDVQVTEDGQLLVLSGEGGGDLGEDGGVYVYGLTDPAHPNFVGVAEVPFGGVHTVTVASVNGQLYAFAAKNPGFSGSEAENEPGLLILGLAHPASPALVHRE